MILLKFLLISEIPKKSQLSLTTFDENRFTIIRHNPRSVITKTQNLDFL